MPFTARTPITWSRIAPQATRRGPERFAATTPPKVCGANVPNKAEKSGGSAMICWFFAATAASISAIGVPARAERMSSCGEYSVIPENARVDSVLAAWIGRNRPDLVALPQISSGSPSACAARTRSTIPASLSGAQIVMPPSLPRARA